MNNSYYKRLDLIRVISCIAILLYHIGILKGGYLAVCTFFVLTGYFSVISYFKRGNLSLKDYYKNKFKRLYLPLIIIVFLTIGVTTLIPNITLNNIKPEVTSILLGYNNYWQLNANLDYFVRHISSPFMHLWFIAIILQFELIIPFILKLLDILGRKVSKALPLIILFAGSAMSYFIFYSITKENIMTAYYGSATRLFSLTLGILIGFIHTYFKPKENKKTSISFKAYLILLLISLITISFKSKIYPIAMLLVTLISMQLINYGVFNKEEKTFDKIVSFFTKISYEFYLVQYPIIYIFQSIKLSNLIKIPLIITITIIISSIINFALNIKKQNKLKVLRIFTLIIILVISVFGFYKYVSAKDYTKEMKKLEEDLNKNRKLIKKQQKQYIIDSKKAEDEWQQNLNDLNINEEQLKEKVRNLHIVGVGDSIMELAIKDLYDEFPNGYFDAKENRTTRQLNDVLEELNNKKVLGDIVVINIGTNGEFYKKYTDEIMEKLKDKEVFWLNATHADYDDFNDKLTSFASNYDNVHIIDWVSVAKKHPEYIISDGVHPTIKGCKAYTETIFNAIYEKYLEKLNKNKEEKIKEHEKEQKNKITFVGNDLLLGIYDYIKNDYQNSSFIIEKDINYKTLKKKLNENDLNHKIVFIFNQNTNITEDNYLELIKLYKQHEIYIVTLYDKLDINNQNIKIIDFSKEIQNNKNYLSHDGVHLTKEGNKKLKEKISESLK